jgi:hypothetical protein
MAYLNIREEELKHKIAEEYFLSFDCTRVIGNVDFSVMLYQTGGSLFEQPSLLWAEAKAGTADINKSIAQLILTIGKARTFDKYLPPAYLGAFDGEKIAFIPYSDIHDIFYQNDFNWNVTPSNYETKEFQQVHERVKKILDEKALLYYYDKDSKDLKWFIKINFVDGKYAATKTRIDKNNFMVIYNKWLAAVKPTIAVNWDIAKKSGIIDGDFYLADLLSRNNESLREKLNVLLQTDHYISDRILDAVGMYISKRTEFKDKQKAHHQFWNKYERPPREEYWEYIRLRRDLLVPQDVRERKGSYYTPQIWVELSQKYIADVLGPDWQDEYYIWDCAAGTGNLLVGLVNKYNIWASTLDKQDVEVIHDRIDSMNQNSAKGDGANLLQDHVFQFDFLNDDFSKLPKALKDIIDNAEERKKLIIYINPPYAEASSRDTVVGTGENKSDVSTKTKIYTKYLESIGTAGRELFTQFIYRVYVELKGAKLAQFSKLKMIQSSNFLKIRKLFDAEYKVGFVVPANTFDNVKGEFPIGFFIWDTNKNKIIESVECDVYDWKSKHLGKRKFYANDNGSLIIDWLRKYYDKKTERIAYLRMIGTDMQNNPGVFFTNQPSENDVIKHLTTNITKNNVIEMCIYLSMRHSIESSWITDRDQFLYPIDGWQFDTEFQNDCLAFALFNGQNKISGNGLINNFIPFTEKEVNARDKFESNFMSDFIKGKIKQEATSGQATLALGETAKTRNTPLEFSPAAVSVFTAGRKLWQYYHTLPLWETDKKDYKVNASLYDIREHFQGRNDAGKMNNKSVDAEYQTLINNLRTQLKLLARKIEPKVYEYGFLKR